MKLHAKRSVKQATLQKERAGSIIQKSGYASLHTGSKTNNPLHIYSFSHFSNVYWWLIKKLLVQTKFTIRFLPPEEEAAKEYHGFQDLH